jgi:signal transduction histidine kinase
MPAQQARTSAGEAAAEVGRRSALSVYVALAVVIAVVVTLIWALTGAGYFWPRWVWFGVGAPAALWASVGRARRVHDRGPRRFAVLVAVAGVLSVMMVLIWWFGHPGWFWPAWPIGAYVTVVAGYAVFLDRGSIVPWLRERRLNQRVEELTRTRRGALDVQAAELRRIERDLHDGAQARLVALSMKLGRAEERLGDEPETAELVRQARLEAADAIAELRDLARGIAPPVLADRGLVAAVDALGRRSPVPVIVEGSLAARPAPVVETAAYFVAAESLTNVAKHAGGASARVSIAQTGKHLVIEIADDGPGGADPAGSGLTGLRRRVEALDGTLIVTSPPGAGTTVRAELPCVL